MILVSELVTKRQELFDTMAKKYNSIPNNNLFQSNTYSDGYGFIRVILENFDWGDLYYADILTIEREIFFENVYCCWRDVKEGDIVVDIGASVGPFVYSIINNNPQKIYCVEPSKKLIKTLEKNFSNYFLPAESQLITTINKAIVSEDSNLDHVHIFIGEHFHENDDKFEGISFQELIHDYSIEKINFLKIDCEGGEYDIFREENMNFLLNQVEYIAMEVHLNQPNCREKFKNFRDNYLIRFKDFRVLSCTRQNIAWGTSVDLKNHIFDDKFIDEYTCEFMIYILN